MLSTVRTKLLTILITIVTCIVTTTTGFAAPQLTPEVLVVAADPAHAAAKVALLKEAAQRSGIKVRHVFATALQDKDYAALYNSASLVLFDTGKRDLADGIDSRAGGHSTVPMVQLFANGIKNAARRGVTETEHKTLQLYYHNGGRHNFENLFRFMAKELFRTANIEAQPPVVIPEEGVYHPAMPGQVAESSAIYLASKQSGSEKEKPVIGLVFARALIVNGQLALIDEMIRQTEQHGAIPLPVFFSDRPGNQLILQKLLLKNNKPMVHALIYTGALHVPGERRAEIESLQIPVLGTLKFRPGSPEDWQKSQVGLPMASIPSGYATPEYAGIIDAMLIASETRDNSSQLLKEQFSALLNKASNLTQLQKLPNSQKRIAIMVYNTPPGEKNMSASNLNIPESLHSILAGLAAAGYTTSTPGADRLRQDIQRLLAPFYRDNQLEGLLKDGLAETVPVSDYLAWFNTLPEKVRRKITARWGTPEHSSMVIKHNGQNLFVIPRLKIGNVIVTRQPPRGDRIEPKEAAIYHDTKLPPNHFYLASYLWARTGFKANALVHLGTHGTQEWMPGKERGLSIHDAPNLAVGDLPVVYPYIVANIGEAIQAKRRGRAVIISHQTPPYAPSGLYDDFLNLHELVHQYASIETPSVRQKVRQEIISKVLSNNYNKDMGWSEERINQEFPHFIDAFHAHLHTLAEAVQPLGLHSFGVTPQHDHRLFTVLQMLGKPFYQAVLQDDEKVEELFAVDFKRLKTTEPYLLLERHVLNDLPLPPEITRETADFIQKARRYFKNMDASTEISGFLTALNGQHVPSSTGDDPIRNPDSHPTGRNIYGFDPAKVPSRQAWDVGQEALTSLIDKYRQKHGRPPEKLAFTLWSVETMRQQGVVEAQILHALGVRPVWDEGGRVTGVELIPAIQLGRPRIDVVVTASGAHRDMFPNALKRIEQAVSLVADNAENDNPVSHNSRVLAKLLTQKGMSPEQARQLSTARIFSTASGVYGLKLDDASLASDTWGEGKNGKQDRTAGEAKLADLYMNRIGYLWGEEGDRGSHKELFAEHLKKVDAAVLARSSNIYGVVNTDDPFQFLGGVTLAVRSLTGKSPDMYISDLRIPGKGKTESAANFIATEMRTRYFHPNWVAEMKKEGYAGAVEMVKVANNFWGWQAMTPEAVRPDQWQEMADVYVHDKHKLGMKEWFEKEHPHAQAQMIERMLEAVRKEYWNAPPETVQKLKERYRELADRYRVTSDNRAFSAFVREGFGLDQGSTSSTAHVERPVAQPQPVAPAVDQPIIRGMQLQKVTTPASIPLNPVVPALIPVLACIAGLLRQLTANRDNNVTARRNYAIAD